MVFVTEGAFCDTLPGGTEEIDTRGPEKQSTSLFYYLTMLGYNLTFYATQTAETFLRSPDIRDDIRVPDRDIISLTTGETRDQSSRRF